MRRAAHDPSSPTSSTTIVHKVAIMRLRCSVGGGRGLPGLGIISALRRPLRRWRCLKGGPPPSALTLFERRFVEMGR